MMVLRLFACGVGADIFLFFLISLKFVFFGFVSESAFEEVLSYFMRDQFLELIQLWAIISVVLNARCVL